MNQTTAPNTDLKRFRMVAFLEGISFIVLLFIAMPLKYVWDMPLAVRITGSVHGFLFIAFLYYLLLVRQSRNWSLGLTAMAFVASLVPFGTFVLDRKLREG